MKKIALFLVIAMAVAGTPGLAMVHATVDGFIQDRKGSELSPIRDTGLVLEGVHKGVHQTYDAVAKPFKPVLDPIMKVRDVALESTKLIINKTWDLVTFSDLRAAKG